MITQKKNLIAAFITAVSLVILISILSYARINAFIESAASVNHTTLVTLELEKIKSNFRDSETAQRGYLLTHDTLFLEKFNTGLLEYPKNIANVKKLTSDNAEQQKSLSQVELLAQQRKDYLNKMIEVDKSRAVTTEEFLVGQAVMDSLRSKVNTMIAREDILLDQRSNELLKQSLYAPIFLSFASILALAVLIFSYLKLNKSIFHEHELKAERLKQEYELELSKEKLRNEHRFRDMVEQAPVAITLLRGKDFVVEIVNEKQLQSWGRTKEEILNKPIFKDIPEEQIKWLLDKLNAVLETGEPYTETELPSIRVKDGIEHNIYVNFICEPFYEDHEIVGILAISTDVTEQVLDRMRVEESEKKLAYRTALLEAHNEASVDGILLVDAKGKILSYNERFIEIWNMPRNIVEAKDDEAALAFAMSQLLHPQQFIDKVKSLYDHPNKTILDYLEFKDGKILERNGYPVIGQDGDFYAWSWTFKDVTRQKQYEKEIKDSEVRFRSLAQTLPQLIWVTDGQGKQEFASNRWKEYSGMECIGELEWKAMVHPEDYDRINADWIHSLTTGNIYKSEVRLKNRDGEHRWHSVIGEPVFDKNNSIIKWVGAFSDINEQKLNDERKDEFISIASHEMKTPLTTAKAYLQMLELTLEESNEEANLFTQKANGSIDRLTELVSELLDVSKIRHGKIEYSVSQFNFNDLIYDTVESIQLTSPTHKLITTGKVNDQVFGDKHRLQQVVINLLSNAIKYSPGENEVYVTIMQEEDTIQVSVKDNGIGIAQSSLNKIFDKYHRIADHAVLFQGLGIGLFISYEIIQRHNGKLWAKSEVGKGSTFYFTLPINCLIPELSL